MFHGCRSRRVLVALALWMVAPSMLLAEELSSPSAVLRDALARRDRARGLKKAGDRQANRGRMAQALVSYREALSLDPQYVAAHRARAELLLQLQREGEALRCYRMALRDNPKSVELWRGYAFVLRRLGQYDEAMAAYRRCRQLAPDDPSLLYGIALAHRAMGDVPAAIGAFNTFLLKETRVSQRAWVAEARANVLALGGRPVQSPLLGSPDGHGGTKPEMPNNGGAKPGALMRHVPIPRPKAPRAELRGADALRAQGDALARHANCADALIRYGQAVKRDAFNLRAYDGLAYCTARTERFAQGTDRMRIALRDNRRYLRGWLYLARLRRLAGDPAGAAVAYRKYLTNPRAERAAMLELAAALRTQGHAREAAEVYARYLSLVGDDGLAPGLRRRLELAIQRLKRRPLTPSR